MPRVYSAEMKKKKEPAFAKATARRGKDNRVVEEIEKMCEEGLDRCVWQNLIVCPKKTKFESQNGKELILIMARKHLATNIGWILAVLVLSFVPLFWGEFPLIALVSSGVRFGIFVLWYLGLSLFAFQKMLLWFYNIYIITDERIVDVDFFGLLYKNINVTQIRQVEDVNYSQIGLMSSIFNFGDVVIQTASEQMSDDMSKEQSAFTFQAISRPDRVARVVMQLMEQEEKESYEGRVR
ncbi:PH domain-containing protein [Patescibacteria group bacterium]|nr:PH domain-containing protein [Patescibacteria group bacterium]